MSDIETRVAALEQHVSALLADNAQLRADNAELRHDNAGLRAQVAALAPAPETGHGDAAADPAMPEVAARSMSRRGMIAAVAGAAGGVVLANAAPAAAADGEPVLLGRSNFGNNTTISATNTSGVALFAISGGSGFTSGVRAIARSFDGRGVFGEATASTGTTYGVYGRAVSRIGYGVFGENAGTTGREGFAVFAKGRFKATGRSFIAVPGTAPDSTELDNGSLSFYVDNAARKLRIMVKFADGRVGVSSIAFA